ncbi:hypothetical protein MJO28_015539 [Puccinia striiformis f. sp. tritici]|uniref:Uncharacterized protein n=1 Tax=Puccinia striiformis f. sp. tritici TaxID=168172 RepID=A0ACC0DP02_9BASI|nr:hypothetical protein MJO28_015539 [Puccinia striiformis f. sp. tritici]
MSESNPSTSSTTSEPAKDSEIRFRQPLVIDLKEHGDDCVGHNQGCIFPEVTPALSTEKVDSNEALLNKLFSELLPLLARQLNTLSLLLNPEDIRRDPGSKLTRLSELQLAIDHSMTRVAYSMALICPRPLHTFDRVDDHKLERFKSFWLNKLVESIGDMQFQVSVALNAACEHIEALNLCIVHEFMEDTVCEFMEGRGSPVYAGSIYIPSAFINSTIKLRSESELTVAIRLWKLGAHMIPKQLRQAIGSLGSSPDHVEIRGLPSSRQVVRESVIHLTEHLLSIMKLSRLFFNKILRSGINREGLPAYTEMNSKQLRCLCNSACNVSFDLSGLVDLLQTAERSLPANLVDTRNFTEVVQTLASRFEALLLLFRTYLVPLIRQTDQDHYKNWFAIWDTQFTLAVIRFQNLARSIGHIP